MKVTNYNVYEPTNFKSTYPVVHWIAETNGSYAPVASLDITRKLQGKIVRVLNKSLSETKKPMDTKEQNLRTYIAVCDADYRNIPIVRSFYDKTSFSPHKFIPISYIISGKDVTQFNDLLCKNIGVSKKEAIKSLSTPYSQKTLEALEAYNKLGLQFVNDNNHRIRDPRSMTYVLHTKFQIIRNKFGEIKDYVFQDARFLPESGKHSPFEKIK